MDHLITYLVKKLKEEEKVSKPQRLLLSGSIVTSTNLSEEYENAAAGGAVPGFFPRAFQEDSLIRQQVRLNQQ